MEEKNEVLSEYIKNIKYHYKNEENPVIWYPLFHKTRLKEKKVYAWIQDNFAKFLKGTANNITYNRWYFTENGYITTLQYSPSGSHVIVGHSSGLIQVFRIPLCVENYALEQNLP